MINNFAEKKSCINIKKRMRVDDDKREKRKGKRGKKKS